MAAQMKESEEVSRKKLQKSYFDVLGLCCASEVPLIENILKSLDGVKEFSVIVPTRTVIVVHDDLLVSQLQIVKALNQARLEANIRVHGETKHQQKWPNPFAVASGVLLLLSLLKFVFHPLRWLALGAVAVGILPIFLKSLASLRNFRLDTNVLMLVAVIGTIAMNDYIEAGTIVFLFTIAEWLESRASHKANAVMSSLMSITPQKAVIAETGEEVDADEVKLNTVLAVKAGEVVPIDGIVVDGTCEVDEKTLTGESFPVPKQADSTVWAGTINLNGYVSVRTTALAEDCVVAKMAKLVEEAQNSKTKTQRFIDKFAQYYTPAVIIISAGFAVIPLALRVHNRNRWFHLALVVLVSACPCALILSTPVATFCALTKAATTGLLIKGGDYLETLGKIKAMAFDKTGTITRGEFVVTDFQSLCDDISLDTLLYWVTSIESKSSHPMAAALVDYGRSHSIEPKPESVEEFQNFPGEGIQGKIEGKEIYVGNRKIAHRASGTVPTVEGDKKTGKTVGYVYYGATLAGIFHLSDSCRTGVAAAIKELKSLGIRTVMLTGDSEAAAAYAQEQLENALEVVHAELLPEDKATIIRELKKGGPTAMIGDGLNDAPALATADIGISMGISGSALATETGHVILMSNDLRKVPKAIRLARKAHRKVLENIIMSMTTKSAILALAFAGHPLVWAAVLADVGTCLLVILNSMLLLRDTHNHKGKCCKSSGAPHLHKHGHENSSGNHHNDCCSTKKIEKVASGNCQKNCCSSQKVEKVPSDNCPKKCCSSPKIEKVASDDCRKNCGSSQKAEKAPSHNCPKKCCSSPKIEKVASDNCRKNCCSSQKVEKVPLDNCAEKCCSSPKIEKLVSDNCQKNCCSNLKVEKVPSDNCPKNCCSIQTVEKVTSDNCRKNCCSSQKVEIVPSSDDSHKSCCSTEKVEKVTSDNCGKNCCSSQKVEKVPSDNCPKTCCSTQKVEKVTSNNSHKSCCSSQNVEKLPSDSHGNDCCSSEKVEKVQCGAQKSCCGSGQSSHHSVSSCGNRNSDACVESNPSGVQGAKHFDRGCCNTISLDNDIEANLPHSHDCSSPHTLSSYCCDKHDVSVETQGNDKEGEALRCRSPCCEPATHHGIHHHSSHSSQDLEESKRMASIATSCHSNHCCKDNITIHNDGESSGEIVESSGNHHHRHDQEIHHESKKCRRSTSSSQLHTVIDIEPIHTCMSLEKREIGGCCKSYMKECCSNHGQFTTGFGGGLSEIIIKQV